MIQIKNTLYVVEIDGTCVDTITESKLYEKLASFKRCDVDIFKVTGTYVLNNLNNTVAYIIPLVTSVERI